MKSSRLLKIILVSLSMVVTLVAFQNCSNSMAPMDLDQQATLGSTTESLAMGVLVNKCYQCHSPGINMGGIDYITDVPSLKYYRVAIPGQAAASPLYTVLSERDDHSSLLAASEVQLIYNWVQTGMEAAVPGAAPSIVPLNATYTSIFRNIIQTKCASCHINGGNFPRGNLNYTNYTTLMASPNVVDPGNANGSLLYQAVTRAPGAARFMPQGGQQLTPAEQQAIMDWINSGAPNN
ncbi:MAG: hypothetical protein K0R29_2158 [Pseudobdellovibrio sp.]|jgi:uncharacterized membrane protein|nr:hypothetical protein [Pseudobdellovibrio sp.]